VFSIIPRDMKFFDLFDEAADLLVRAGETYVKLLQDYAARDKHVAEIRKIEHAGDDITRRALHRLDTTFITPFDREDIYALMKRIDDVIDDMDAATKRLTLYQVPQPTPWLVKQSDVLSRACRTVAAAIRELRNLKKPAGLEAHLVELHQLENEGDDINHAAVAELYKINGKNPIEVMMWKEIYDLTERSIDRCEDVANIIEGIKLKNA
jgi:uncharacterized protein